MTARIIDVDFQTKEYAVRPQIKEKKVNTTPWQCNTCGSKFLDIEGEQKQPRVHLPLTDESASGKVQGVMVNICKDCTEEFYIALHDDLPQ